METFWLILGIAVLAIGLIDLFLTALDYNEAGFLATRLCRLLWRGMRTITRRLSRRWRPGVLRQVTGLQIMLSVTTWLGCVIVGSGLIYYSQMVGTNFQYAGGDHFGAGVFSAMYLSAAQLATVGTSQVSPETNMLRVLSIAETLSGVVIVTLSLSFLLGVYEVIRDLRTLCANFLTPEADTGDLMASLRPFFPEGQPVGLDAHLQSISDSFWSYSEGLRLHHIAYYFQSGRDQFSLPYTLHMMGRTIAALKWGLPTGHAASLDPSLARLMTQLEQFTADLHHTLSWTSSAAPEMASLEEFSAVYAGDGSTSNYWLGRFFRLNDGMAELAQLDPRADKQDAYDRYRRWLPFAYRTQQMAGAVSEDLDYQPIIHSEEAREAIRQAGNPSWVPFSRRTLTQTWQRFQSWVVLSDPGLTRLALAAAATLAAVVSALTLIVVLKVLNIPVMPAALFGGMVGMYAASMPGDPKTGDRKMTTAMMALPVIIVAPLGAAVASSFALSSAVLAIVVFVGVWISRFGPRYAALGQMAFMAYYFVLLLRLPLTMFPAIAATAVVGAVWAYLFRFVLIVNRPELILISGINGLCTRLVLLLDPIIDAVSGARWDPDLRRRVRADLHQLHQRSAILQGQLRAIDPTTSATKLHARQGELRLLVFDTELAADNLMTAARDFAHDGATISVVLRAQVAGMLERTQARLRLEDSHGARPPESASHEQPEDKAQPPQQWPESARRLHGAVHELLTAARAMRDAQDAALADPHEAVDRNIADADGPASQTAEPNHPAPQPPARGPVASTARAVQAALATGLALFAGMAVTTDHQYWAALAAFLVLGGTSTLEETAAKGGARVFGTIIGAGVGFAVTIITGANPVVVLPLMIICVFATLYTRAVSYAAMVFWTTMMLALLYEFLGTLTTETLLVRVLETVIGAVIALGVVTFILPVRTSQKLSEDNVALLKTLDGITQSCLKRLSGNTDTPSLTSQALTLDQQFRQVNTRAEPLRHNPGALGQDGIERQLTSTAALTYYARHLIKATEAIKPAAAPLPAELSTKLATVTQDNIAALIQVLDGEQAGPTHGTDDLPLEADAAPGRRKSDDAGRDAVHNLVRINQAVLTLINELTPNIAKRPIR